MTGVILPISATEPREPRRGFYELNLLFRVLGQSPARSLQGLDALYLGAVNHPDAVELLGLHLAILEKSVEVVDIPPSVFCDDYMGRKDPELDDFAANLPRSWQPRPTQPIRHRMPKPLANRAVAPSDLAIPP